MDVSVSYSDCANNENDFNLFEIVTSSSGYDVYLNRVKVTFTKNVEETYDNELSFIYFTQKKRIKSKLIFLVFKIWTNKIVK